jgi:hypothetical protein
LTSNNITQPKASSAWNPPDRPQYPLQPRSTLKHTFATRHSALPSKNNTAVRISGPEFGGQQTGTTRDEDRQSLLTKRREAHVEERRLED